MEKLLKYFRLYSGLKMPELKPLETISADANLTEMFKSTTIAKPKE